MSVYVSDFTTWEVIHDDARGGAHQGTVVPATIVHTTNMDGSPNWDFIIVTCPVCGSSSTHPVGGGSQPVPVQTMFVKIAERDGCCGTTLAAAQSTDIVSNHIKEHVTAMDGEGRWALDMVPV